MTRSKKAVLNTITSILFEIVAAVCSFILPRLILSHFGSAYNGVTSSICQFISCIALLKSGIGSVTRAALYKPLAMHDENAISSVFVATEKFMQRIALIFVVALLFFAALYPFAVKDQFSWGFAFTLVLILGISTFAQYYFGMAHQMLLDADQRQYVATIINIGGVLLNTLIAAVLIFLGCSIHFVQLGSAVVFAIQPIALMFYVSRRYHINRKVIPNNKALSQRWDAFGHQLASFVNTNTDIIVLTLATNVFEVSVYTIYCMVAHAVRKVITGITGGVCAAFGNMLAKEEYGILHKYFKIFDCATFVFSLWAFSCTAVLIVPFVGVYTRGVYDVDYTRDSFGYLLAFSEFLVCVKIPYQILVQTFGYFKQTKKGAFVEAGLNIVTSVIFVCLIGLDGVLIGTIIAALYRTIDYGIVAYRKMLKYEISYYIKKIVMIGITGCVLVALNGLFKDCVVNSYGQWVGIAVMKSTILLFVVTICSLLFYRNETKETAVFVTRKIKGKIK